MYLTKQVLTQIILNEIMIRYDYLPNTSSQSDDSELKEEMGLDVKAFPQLWIGQNQSTGCNGRNPFVTNSRRYCPRDVWFGRRFCQISFGSRGLTAIFWLVADPWS